MFWAGIINSEIVGPFRVPDGVKMDAEAYGLFLKGNFEPWYNSRPANEKKGIIFMQDNAPSHAARHSMAYLASIGIYGSRLMVWPRRLQIVTPYKTCGR